MCRFFVVECLLLVNRNDNRIIIVEAGISYNISLCIYFTLVRQTILASEQKYLNLKYLNVLLHL